MIVRSPPIPNPRRPHRGGFLEDSLLSEQPELIQPTRSECWSTAQSKAPTSIGPSRKESPSFKFTAKFYLLEYAPGLRPRPNTPGTQRTWKSYAPPRLVHLRFRQNRWADWLCISPHLSPASWLATLPACGLDHKQPGTHRAQRQSVLLLLLEAGLSAEATIAKEKSFNFFSPSPRPK